MASGGHGSTKTRTVRVKRKNGDIYVEERTVRYDPEKKYERIVSRRLVGKIPKGGTEVVPTRPKRSSGTRRTELEHDAMVKVRRIRVGMMDILDHAGQASGIDDALLAWADEATARKIIALARYLVATGGSPLPEIEEWQIDHPLPYAEGITESMCHELFRRIARDEALIQSFFRRRCQLLVGGDDAVACGLASIPPCPEHLDEAAAGFSEADDGLGVLKLLTLWSSSTRQPVAFTMEQGDVPDATCVGNAIAQLEELGVKGPELVLDADFGSCEGRDFFGMGGQLAGVRCSTTWSPQVLRGRMFVQFVALCYFEWIHGRVREMKQVLGVQDPGHPKTEPELKGEEQLLDWLNHKSVHQLLLWFDLIEDVSVPAVVRNRRWNAGTAMRDRLFMAKLGVLAP